ncbi:translation initiation factor IF-2 subunit alpha [Methanococcus voltae]|jgi:translation initiation factor 2 subunit 1|uniref:Translation initiation factor 2 subunit alpha n=2 Tax=Methanococcus voltae TaxID=2188 RepID=A0A8J7RGS4_METVO|nr:translation initiation factor IF-2 subunit alpha [Methanococcus voltae]MBP2172393.1 translation initiation factor 2 subunit 1 [Methanococcus voltae]MBP2200651.1 translation initiation factor 2 subunit 1 [Methanococcus voltae]MCS3921376.1 translation initiation factor 2 subunit 1 [Methanococcus voltae PS]
MKSNFPEEGDIVIGNVSDVKSFGAFVELLEYPKKEGMVHISEVSSGWIKNIRDHIKKGQRVVAKVVRVNPNKNQIDLSLKRVTDQQKRAKVQEWKRFQRAEKLLQFASEKLGKSLEDAWKEVGYTIEEEFGELYVAFESLVIEGEEAFEDMDISKEWTEELYKIAKENIELSNVKVDGMLSLSTTEPDGIKVIKKVIKKAIKANPYEDVQVDVSYIGAPKYRIEVIAPDYKSGEEVLRSVANEAMNDIVKYADGKGDFIRIEE